MQLAALSYSPASGWSQPLPAQLDGPQTLVLLFGAPSFAQTPVALQALRQAFPQAVHAGCSTAGEIFRGEVRDGSLSVAVLRFESTRLVQAVTTVEDREDSAAAGKRLAEQLLRRDLRAVLVFSEGVQVNGAAVVDALTRHLPSDVAVAGGLAGDGDRFGSTWIWDGQAPRSHGIVAVGLCGDRIQVGLGSEGGWADFGPQRLITRAQGQVLYELDGRPALDLYKDYLGELADQLPAAALRFPLSVRQKDGADEAVVRTILGVDEAQRALIFAGDIPQGGTARLMRVNHLNLTDSGSLAVASAAGAGGPQGPALCLLVSCVGRRLVLGEHTEEELEAVSQFLPEGSAHVGFYSYGEISPAGGRCSRLHNQTLTVSVLWERPA
ncbi:MAG: FIST signal transduction protein [Rubrivivax sp.]